MQQRMRAIAVALAMAAGALALANPAAAKAAPDAVKLRVDPGRITVGDSPVKATFTFYTRNAEKAEIQIKAPGIGAPTSLKLKRSTEGRLTKWTATEEFDSTSRAGRWNVLAIAHADGAEDSTRRSFEVVHVKNTRITGFDARPESRVEKGDRITVSGRLQIADGDDWDGYRGRTVTITFRDRGTDAYRHVKKVRTGKGGWFKARVRADESGWWRAEYDGDRRARGSVSDTDYVRVQKRTRYSRIVGFDASPEPVAKGKRLTFRGTLQVGDRRDWDAHRGQRVDILFKADGSKRWERVAVDRTDRRGRFHARAEAETSGWFKAVYDGRRGVRGADSRGDHVKVVQPKADTRIVGFDAYREPAKRGGHLHFKGRLQVKENGSWEGLKADVKLYFKARGSDEYRPVKTVRTSGSGWFRTAHKVWRSGHWKVVYGGDRDTERSESARDYVHVRR